MPSAHEPHRGHGGLVLFVVFARSEGWEVCRTADGQLRLVKAGLPPILVGHHIERDSRFARAPRPSRRRSQATHAHKSGRARHG